MIFELLAKFLTSHVKPAVAGLLTLWVCGVVIICSVHCVIRCFNKPFQSISSARKFLESFLWI